MPKNQDGSGDRDLAALLAKLFPQLMALETPILKQAGITMWEYAILTELAHDTAISQVTLSRRTGRDTTRLGKHLADLEARELITRRQAPDARQRTVSLTPRGSETHEGARRAIRAAEDGLLAERLSPAEASALRRILTDLVGDED